MNRQPFLYVTGATILGILVAQWIFLPFQWIHLFFVFLSLIFSVLFWLNKRKNLASIFLIISFFVLGFLNYTKFNQLPKTHYTKHFKAFQKAKIQVQILEELKSTPKYKKFIAKIQYSYNEAFEPTKTDGKVLFYVSKKEKPLCVDDQLLVEATYFPIEESVQYQGYIDYLKRKLIFGKLFVTQIETKEESIAIFTKIHQWKTQIANKLKENGYSKEVVQLIQSLLLGVRTEMDNTILQSFQKLGVMHILSISGLHTAIVFAIVFVFGNVVFSRLGGKRIAILVALLFVILFTFFVGLQPPVLRTTLMLLLYYGSYFLQRKANIYHSLLLSAFILLSFNPNFLFDIGFQLSFVAVFFIVWLYKLFEIKTIKNKIATYFTDIVSVSLAAQIGTLPLSLYYFHTTSLLFLVGNLLFVPFSFGFILVSFVVLFLSSIDINIPIFVQLINKSVEIILNLGFWLSNFSVLVFENIHISKTQVVISYLILICLPFLFKKYNYQFKIIYFVLILMLLWWIF